MNSYPDKFARGVSSKDAFDQDGRPTAALFADVKYNELRGCGFNYDEASINWCDCIEAITILMNQFKKDSDIVQFPYGVAILDRKLLDQLRFLPLYKDFCEYERYPIDGNRYHGNILVARDLSSKQKSYIKCMVASCCKERISNPHNAEAEDS